MNFDCVFVLIGLIALMLLVEFFILRRYRTLPVNQGKYFNHFELRAMRDTGGEGSDSYVELDRDQPFDEDCCWALYGINEFEGYQDCTWIADFSTTKDAEEMYFRIATQRQRLFYYHHLLGVIDKEQRSYNNFMNKKYN